MPQRDPPPPEELVIGLADASVQVARYFETFDWEGAAPDPGVLSAEDFLAALD